MNRIFKVIWSKTKHCYIVVSEYAKANTKAVHTGLRTTAAAAAVAAMLLAPVNYNYAWAADPTVTVEVVDSSTTTQTATVYTTDGAYSKTETDNKLADKANAADVYSKTETDNKLADKANAADVYSKTETDNKLTDKANATDVYSKTEADNADKQLQTNIDTEKTAREAGDKALDDRITAVKDYVLNETGNNYVSKADAAVQDGAIVKADKTIGENVTNLDAALAKETADRIGADAAQDKVIQQVNENAAAGIKTLTEAYNNEVAARQSADTNLQTNINNEAAARKAADTKLVEAVNSGLSLSKDNVLQKNTTSVGEDGTVSTSKEAATTLVMNKDGKNQITLSESGIKVGLNSGVMDKDGFYAGGDTADAAKAALKADGSIKGGNGKFTVDKDGKVTAASGKIGNVDITSTGAVSGVTDLIVSGTITGNKLTDGVASLQNGNLATTGNINAHDIVVTGDISGKAITGTSLNTQGGAISGGAITGTTISGTTGSFGSLTTTGNASVGGTLSSNGLTNTGNATTDTLKVNHNATVGGDLTVTGDITGKSLNVGTGAISGGQITGTGLDVGAGTIKTTGTVNAGDVQTGTLKTTGNAEIGGNLTVDKNLTVNGTFDSKTLSSKLGENNYTTITGGNVTSVNSKVSVDDGRTYTSTSNFNEKGRTDTAADGTTRNVSVMTAGGSDSTISSLANENQKSYITQNLKKILQGIKNGTNESIINQTETGIKSTATDGKNTASTNLSNNGFNTYATDGTNETYTKQTAADIKNTAENGMISNTAKDLVNTATENMINTVGKDLETTVGGEMKTTVTGKVTEDFKADLSITVGGNKNETVTGTSTETVTRKKTETYKGGLETTVTGEEKHTVNGSQINAITGSQTNTIGGSQTTTVTGDSSLTAENISNTAKNKITNKALDVETDAASSIVNKVSNDAGSNTSTQLSYQTKEEMSQADGKTASYLRGAAEEKSQLIDGDKKTTIDTIAGQTNTNITEGKNVSNSLQKADQIASSVTDGTNTTVVNQNVGSIASSITDGTKVNNSNNTVDKSEQLIKASGTQYSATSKTATKMEDALVSGSSFIDVIKNLDDAAKPFIGSAVTDGTNSTGVTQTAKDITNTAKNGTIANEAKDITNNATENMTNTVGKDLTTTVGGNETRTVEGTLTETVTGDVTEVYKANLSTTVGGNQTTTVTGDSSLKAENITNEAKNKITNKAIDVETDATSSIVQKVTNDAGSNTSTQLSYQTKEEMRQADGKTASYLRGAAEEKSQLIDGSKKTTIDTIAGQTNTNITDGTNTSNDLQKADQIASSVTDGTNTTVVNQNAKSLASSITDGTKANNTNSTVDKSEQLIKASDTQFYAETRTAEKAEEALRSGNTVINIVKDTKTATVSSAVTDGATITGISQNAKDISLSAAGGTITNTAKKLVNTATGDMENKVGGNLTNNVTGNMTSNVTGDSSLSAKNITNTAEEKLSNSAAEIENSASKSITDKVGANVERTMTTKKISESVKDGTKSNSFSKTAEKDINIITDGTKTSTLSQLADSVNTSLKEVDGEGKTTKSLSNLKTVSEDTTKMTDAATGEFSKRSQTVSQIQDQVGKTTVTTTEGLTKLTNEGGTHKTEMDFADVLKNLGVRGNAAVDGNTTLGKKDADTTLTVNSKSTFKDTVKMEKTLEVDGTSNFNDKVTVTKGGLNVTGGTTTDTLHVTSTSTFDGTATFKDIVTMEKDLSVGGNATVAGDVTANSYKVGNKTYIDANGINANGQKITNVAAGTEDSDAANYGQLREVETRVDGVENRVDKMDSRIDKVGANAAAMANLHPLEFDEDSKWNVAAAVGNYKGETAAAVGAFYRPNEDVMFNLSTTFGNDENMVGGGLSLRLGKGGNREKDKKLKAAIAENNDLRAKVDDLTARMDALLSVINPNMSKEFPDVPENHWAYEAVTRLAGNDIVQGYEDGKFHGERTMTRYEMAELIYNALSRGAKAEKKLVEEFKPELQAMAAQKQAK